MSATEALKDDSLMPFGNMKGTAMGNIPAKYLMWLHDNASFGVRKAYPEVFEYIKDNKEDLKKEAYGMG